jgi:type IV secretion system protein VirB5
MKRILVLFICVCTILSGEAQAGIPVFDAANLARAIEQVTAWAKQFQQMEQQHAAVTGSRGLGSVNNNPELKNVVPIDAAQIYSAVVENGSQGLTQEAQQIRNETKIYNCEGREGIYAKNCNAKLAMNPQDLAYAKNALMLTSERVNQIQSLMNQINATNDPKSIAELHARLQAETTQVANDQNRLVALRSVAEAQQQRVEQQLKEHVLLNLSRKESGIEDFNPRSLQP